jgi:hypothetical protein
VRLLLDSVKRLIRSQFRHLPGEGRAVLDAYRQIGLLRRKAATKLHLLRGINQPDPDTVYWIDPARIVYHTSYMSGGQNVSPEDRVFYPGRDKGRAYGGSWDVSTFRFDDLALVRALRQRIERGVDWRETEFYVYLRDQIKRTGAAAWRGRSQSDLDARCEYIDRLIASMRTHGYQLNHRELRDGEDKGLDGNPDYAANISVNIGRNGQYLFQDGRPCLGIAKILGISRVPVKVLVRHKQWVEFREFVRSLAHRGGGSSQPKELYQNPVHPDLQDLPTAHRCEDRFEAMKSRIPAGSGTLVDVGANLGYFCHRFEAIGYSCFAVELLPHIALAAAKIRNAEGRIFPVIAKDLFEAAEGEPLRDRHFNVVLALSIFHHFLKKRETFERFKQWLARLRVDIMMFEPHCRDERQMTGAYANFDEKEFVDFILAHSCLNQAQLIHRCQDGRPIYRLSR